MNMEDKLLKEFEEKFADGIGIVGGPETWGVDVCDMTDWLKSAFQQIKSAAYTKGHNEGYTEGSKKAAKSYKRGQQNRDKRWIEEANNLELYLSVEIDEWVKRMITLGEIDRCVKARENKEGGFTLFKCPALRQALNNLINSMGGEGWNILKKVK